MYDRRCTALVLAAGSGRRMGAEVPKQYMDLGGAPLFTHAYRRMEASPVISDIVLVVPDGDETCARACLSEQGLGAKLRAVTAGGAERYDSVAGGLEAVTWPCDIVFIQDGARPFPEETFLRDLYDAVAVEGADGAVAAVPVKDTIKVSDAEGCAVSTPDRRTLWQVQTPQVFPFGMIRDAYRQLPARRSPEGTIDGRQVTDDAMVAEAVCGARIRLVTASYRNLKVTTPEDLLIAEAFIRSGI